MWWLRAYSTLVQTYLSNRSITSVMPWAVGCLTGENTKECRVVFAQCRVFFFWLFSLLIILVTFFIARKFCKLLFTVERGMFVLFCYFFLLLVSFRKLLFTVEKGQGLYWVDCARGGFRGAAWCIFLFFIFYCWGGRGNGYIFPPRYMGLGWKEDGEMGTFRVPF